MTKQTFYQGISGFKAITVGRTDLEVVAHKANGTWTATKVGDPRRLRRRQGRLSEGFRVGRRPTRTSTQRFFPSRLRQSRALKKCVIFRSFSRRSLV